MKNGSATLWQQYLRQRCHCSPIVTVTHWQLRATAYFSLDASDLKPVPHTKEDRLFFDLPEFDPVLNRDDSSGWSPIAADIDAESGAIAVIHNDQLAVYARNADSTFKLRQKEKLDIDGQQVSLSFSGSTIVIGAR